MDEMVARLVGTCTALLVVLAIGGWTHCGYDCSYENGASVGLHGDFDAGPVSIDAHDGAQTITCELDAATCGPSWEVKCGEPDGLRVTCGRFEDPVVEGLHVSVLTPEVPAILDVRIMRGEAVLADRHVAMHYDPCGNSYEDIDF